jgi:hypothetical protein
MRVFLSGLSCACLVLLSAGCSGEGVKTDVNRAVAQQKAQSKQPPAARERLKSMKSEGPVTAD